MTGSSTALIVVTSDLDKPLFEWQETICVKTDYNFRADTWTSLWLPVFVFNIIVSSFLCPLYIMLRYKAAVAAKSKRDTLTIPENKERARTDDQEQSERTPLLQSNSLSQTRDGDPKHDTNGDNNSPTVPDIPAVETNQSVVVPVDKHPESTSKMDDEYSDNNESNNPSSTIIPVDTPHSTTMDSEINYVDTEQNDTNENVDPIVALQQDESEDTETQ